MALLVQGLSLGGLALNYDHGFIVDYNTDLAAIQFHTAADLRDTALAKLDTVIAYAGAATWTATANGFFGPGVTYSNTQIARIANTMAARTLAYFPRNATQNAAVDWARVVSYASNGISSGTPFALVIHQDGCITWCDYLKVWSNDVTTMRVHTRVAHLMDPASQPDPWNYVANAQPSSADKRLGNGAYRGGAAYANAVGIVDSSQANPLLDPVNGGTDYVWTGNKEFGNKSRGAWHQSAIGQGRYDSFPGCNDNPQQTLSPGDLVGPAVLAAENDLIWAEGLIRSGGSGAAALIDKTRVGRGGLAPSAGTLADLQYEQDVELLGSSDAVFYNQRRGGPPGANTPPQKAHPAAKAGGLGPQVVTGGGGGPPRGGRGR